MAGGNAWPFFLFWLDRPEVGSESEPENPYWLSQTIGVLLSCMRRAVSSCWSSVSLVSSSVIFELACTNFSSAFRWQYHSAEALFSAILMLSVRLSWWSLYHSTFLSDSEDASSSVVNYIRPCYLEGLFDLPRQYFYCQWLWCFDDVYHVRIAHLTSFTMCCCDELGHPMDVPGLGLKSSFEYFRRFL